jgi:hypothetical protein
MISSRFLGPLDLYVQLADDTLEHGVYDYPSNMKPHIISGSVCDQEPYHSGCPQILNPERYCLVADDPVFCKTIGDICDADGFVRPEYPYCTVD